MVEIRGYRDIKGSFARWFIIAIVHFLDGSVRRVNEKWTDHVNGFSQVIYSV